MGRIRTIKPELFEHHGFAALSDAAARLLIGVFTLVDDHGHCPATPSYLAGRIFFARPRSLAAIGRLISELRSAGFIEIYEGNGIPHLEIVDWRSVEKSDSMPVTQRIDKPQRPIFPLRTSIHSENDSANDSANGSSNHSYPDPIRSDPDHDHERESEPRTVPRTTREKAHPIPIDWAPSPSHRTRALDLGFDTHALAQIASKFTADADANSKRRTNWDRAFDKWLADEHVPSSKNGSKAPRVVIDEFTDADHAEEWQ